MDNMGKGKAWSVEELEFLESSWGIFKVATIAKKLNRTETAIIIKSKRLGLGASKEAQGLLTANQLAKALHVDIHTVTDYWIVKHGLPAKRKVVRSVQKMWLISISDFWKWAKVHQDKFDSRKFEELSFGVEPDWMKDKRKKDTYLPTKRNMKWTPQEDKRLIELLKQNNLNYKEIGQILGRSRVAIQKRLARIGWDNQSEVI